MDHLTTYHNNVTYLPTLWNFFAILSRGIYLILSSITSTPAIPYTGVSVYQYSSSTARFGEGSGPILLVALSCDGTESSVQDCTIGSSSSLQSCTHYYDVGVRCDHIESSGRNILVSCCDLRPTTGTILLKQKAKHLSS